MTHPPRRPHRQLTSGLLVMLITTTAGCSAGGSTGRAARSTSATVGSSADADTMPSASTESGPTGVVQFTAAGDMILGDTPRLPAHPSAYLDPVRRALTGNGTVVFGNLEGTLTTSSHSKCGDANGGSCFAFRNPPHYARYFAAAGFTMLNDANNHFDDFGRSGRKQTVKAIHHAGLTQTGKPGEITIVHSGGFRVAVVGFAPYPWAQSLLKLKAAAALMRKASKRADVVVAYMHAGAEGSDKTHVTGHEEHAYGEDRGNPEKFAHLVIRAGADLVVASGPHVLRGMEFYRHRLIAYSLGNFANFHNFGGGGVLSESAILHVSLTGAGAFVSGQLRSVRLDGDGRAHLGGDSLSLVRRLSKEDFGSHRARIGRDGAIRESPNQ